MLLHDFRHRCRRFLSFALLELVDLVAVVSMVRVVGVEEVEFWVVDLILSNPGLELRSIPSKK